MSERILNGDFSSGSAYWTNPSGGLAFIIGAGWATGASNPDGALEWTYKMCQQFSSNDEIVTATITVWAAWEAYADEVDGYNQFIVELEKPDTTIVELVKETKTAVVGSENILSASNIADHMTQYGNYKLWLTLVTKSARTARIPREYTQSQGWYDNISIDMTVKKYKTVHEAIGGAESYSKFPKVSEQEIMQLSEAYNKLVKVKRFLEGVKLSETYEITASFNKEIAEVIQLVESFSTKASFKRSAQESVVLAEMYEIMAGKRKEAKELLAVSEAYSFLLRRAVSEIVELAESFNKKVSVSKSEVVRLAEDWFIKGYFHYSESEIVKLAESYAYFKGITREVAEAAKLAESLQAKRTHGNVETTYYIDLPTQWDEIAPATTKWIKSKVERN